jgi:hypothetical protein
MLKKMFAVLGVVAVAGVSNADAQSLAGKWTAEYPTRIQNTNGQVEAAEMGTALVTIELKGDTVIGTWTASAGRDAGAARAIRGTFANGKVTFATEPVERTIMRNTGSGDEQHVVKMTSQFEGEVKGDEITGTFTLNFGDERRTPPMKWTARRNPANKPS